VFEIVIKLNLYLQHGQILSKVKFVVSLFTFLHNRIKRN